MRDPRGAGHGKSPQPLLFVDEEPAPRGPRAPGADVENKKYVYQVGKRGSGKNWEIGIDMYTLLCIK